MEASPEAVSEAVLEAEAVEPEESMDDLLENAFLRACKLSTKKAELPILSSNFYRLHIVASCPPGSMRGAFIMTSHELGKVTFAWWQDLKGEKLVQNTMTSFQMAYPKTELVLDNSGF